MFLRYVYFDTAAAIGDGSDIKLVWDHTRVHTPFISSEFQYWYDRLSGTTAVQFRHPPWVISPDLFIADAYTDASAVAVGSVVMPYTGDEFVEPSYWYDNTTPHAGQIFAD